MFRMLTWAVGMMHRARRAAGLWAPGDVLKHKCPNCGLVLDHVFMQNRFNPRQIDLIAASEHSGPCGLPCINSPTNYPTAGSTTTFRVSALDGCHRPVHCYRCHPEAFAKWVADRGVPAEVG